MIYIAALIWIGFAYVGIGLVWAALAAIANKMGE